MLENGLRKQIEKEKDWYLQKYGVLDWHWYDEGLLWTIQDYESCIGLADFTEDDWVACEENGLSRGLVKFLCRAILPERRDYERTCCEALE